MDIKKISKELTREEFKKKYNYSCMWLFGIGTERDSLQCKLRGSCVKCREEAIKDIKFKGEDNMEVNFIEMMKDSSENKTVYIDSYGVFYKADSFGLLYVKYKGKKDFELYSEIVCKQLACQKYTKVEQYKEITAEEAIKALREGKEFYIQHKYSDDKFLINKSVLVDIHTFIECKFYIKE